MVGTFINNRTQLKSWSPCNHARQLGDHMDYFRGTAKLTFALDNWTSANPYPCLWLVIWSVGMVGGQDLLKSMGLWGDKGI